MRKLLLLIAVLVGLLAGCASDSSNEWPAILRTNDGPACVETGVKVSPGITVVFTRGPTAQTVTALTEAGAVRKTLGNQFVWYLKIYDRLNVYHTEALSAALEDGATLKQYNPKNGANPQ